MIDVFLRYYLRRIGIAAAISVVVGALLAFVLSSVLGWGSVANALAQWMYWLFWIPVVIGILIASLTVRKARGGSHAPVPSMNEVNALSLGRAAPTSITSSVDSYSAYPPESGPPGSGRQRD